MGHKKIATLMLSSVLATGSLFAGQIDDFFLTDPNVISQPNQSFEAPSDLGKMNAYGHVFLRGDKVDQVIEIKNKKNPMSDAEKDALAKKTYKQLKMFFMPGDNIRTESVTKDDFLWKTLNNAKDSSDKAFWAFKKRNYVFVVTKSAYRSSKKQLKSFSDLFGEQGGQTYVEKYVGGNSASNDPLLKEKLTVKFLKASNDHFSWSINKDVVAKKDNDSTGVEFKINNVLQIAKIENNDKREERVSELNKEITLWNKDGSAKEKSSPEDIQLKERLALIDSIEDSPNGQEPDHYILSYTRDFISKYKILDRSVSITKVYNTDVGYVSFNYTIGLIGHRYCNEMQAEISGTNDLDSATGPNKNKVKEIIFTMIDKGFISARNAAEDSNK